MPRIKDVANIGGLQDTDCIPIDRPSASSATMTTMGDIKAYMDAASNNTLTITTAEPLGGHRVATMQGGYADSNNLDHAYSLAGITLQAVSAGSLVTVQTSGPLTELSWNWAMGQWVYLGSAGQLTQTPPYTGFLAAVGRPITPTILMIDMQPTIILI